MSVLSASIFYFNLRIRVHGEYNKRHRKMRCLKRRTMQETDNAGTRHISELNVDQALLEKNILGNNQSKKRGIRETQKKLTHQGVTYCAHGYVKILL